MHHPTTADIEADRAYSVEEAAERIGVCPNTIYNEAAAGKLILRKVRRRTIVRATDLSEYLANLPPLPCDRPAAA
jgi:excisionase family DNA binding protein